jgi:hypothetical protein
VLLPKAGFAPRFSYRHPPHSWNYKCVPPPKPISHFQYMLSSLKRLKFIGLIYFFFCKHRERVVRLGGRRPRNLLSDSPTIGSSECMLCSVYHVTCMCCEFYLAFCLFVALLGLELRAYTLSYSTSPFLL